MFICLEMILRVNRVPRGASIPFKCFRLFSTRSRQSFSSLRISEEVRQAIEEKKPVVALESTIITHGLPYPHNLEMSKAVEQTIREQGAIPATIAFLNGVPAVGLDDSELEHLATGTDFVKISRRDIPYVMSRNLTGGTTIAGTMILAHRANIQVFATGGLGGVHRDAQRTMDISADLDELARTPVAVICSGPKSILDIGLTLEYLETKGVHVSTLGPEGTNIPGFFSSDSGYASPYNFQTPLDAAKIIRKNTRNTLQHITLTKIPATACS